MTVSTLPIRLQANRPGRAALLLCGLAALAAMALITVGPARLIAQIEGDRGIAPIATSHNIQIDGIEVNTTGKDAQEARLAGWALARKMAWAKAGGPAMADGQIESMVVSIVIEREQIGPRRYIAKLGVVFDRQRAGQFIGSGDGSSARHSAPLLVLPVLYSGGAAQVFEARGPWQAAWAQFRSGGSGIDYVRPTGSGGDSLLLTAGQASRRSRSWWRNILEQFSASDVLIPVARLERQWPGGPIRGVFTARYGPDNAVIGSFEMTANDEQRLPGMLEQAVIRMDGLYNQALASGVLRPDPSLAGSQNALDPALAAMINAAAQQEAATRVDAAPSTGASSTPTATPSATPTPVATATFAVQFASPDAGAVDLALSSVRSVPGVQGASTTSLAMGGTSVMRVTYAGSIDELRAALQARGWRVSGGGGALSIRH